MRRAEFWRVGHFTAWMLVVLWVCVVGGAAEYGVFFSFDAGMSWVRSDAGLDIKIRVNDLEPTGKGVIAATDSGLYMRLNGPGGDWQEVRDVPMMKSRILDLASRGGGIMAAATATRGLWMSLDGGFSWVKNDKCPSEELRSLWINEEGMWVGTEAKGVCFSGDMGQSWQERNEGVPELAQIFAMVQVSEVLYAALYQHGLIRWDRSTMSWRKSGQVTPLVLAASDKNIVIGHNPGGIFWSPNAGTTWNMGLPESDLPMAFACAAGTGDGLPIDAAVWQMAGRNETILAGAAAGVYISHTHGRTWTKVTGGIPANSPGIAFALESDRIIAAVQIH